MGLREDALALHKNYRGKLAVASKVKVDTPQDLSLAYTPGVAEPCKEIAADPELSYEYTNRGNMVAVVSDGTAVLGLGDIGPEAGLPVMEGKAILFKEFADVDAVPICLGTNNPADIIQAVKWLEPTFGGINLEDIAGTHCFEVEESLKKIMDIPVFHDDQHGTAVVCCAGVINALKLVKKEFTQARVVVNGDGAAGLAISRFLLSAGIRPDHLTICGINGISTPGNNPEHTMRESLARLTNPSGRTGTLADALKGADVFIGVSVANIVDRTMIASMAPNPVVFAMANPQPEILPDEAKAGGAVVVGTGRSDYPNQINNLLGFPGIFRGTLDVRASDINEAMKVAAARAIAGLIPENELTPDYVIPNPFDRRVVPAVALAVAQAAMDSGVAREPKTREQLEAGLRQRGLL